MKKFHESKLATEAVIDGMLVNAVSKKFIVDIEKVFNF